MTPAEINFAFFAAMGGLFVLDLGSALASRWVNHHWRHRDFRSVIVSIGVLGTFVGVYIGLQNFDTDDIRASVPMLLVGMKTAFITSIVGMGLSIILSIWQRLWVWQSDDATANLQALQAQTRSMAQDLQALLSTQKDAEVQRKKQYQHIQHSLDNAIETLRSSATEQLMTALESVIRDFNAGLSEQFGDNFAELNEAIGRLLAWQEQYKAQLEADKGLLLQAHGLIEENQNQLHALNAGQASLQETLALAAPVIAGLQQQSEALSTELARYGDASQGALQALQHLQNGAQQVAEGLEHQSQTLARMTSEVTRQLPGALGTLEDTLTGLTQRFAQDYQAFLEHYRQLTR